MQITADHTSAYEVTADCQQRGHILQQVIEYFKTDIVKNKIHSEIVQAYLHLPIEKVGNNT